jgi:hypothetical protein
VELHVDPDRCYRDEEENQMKKTQNSNQNPEALAEFAQSARSDDPAGDKKSLKADKHTKRIPASLSKEQKVATKILSDGAHQKKANLDEAGVNDLPDRIKRSR